MAHDTPPLKQLIISAYAKNYTNKTKDIIIGDDNDHYTISHRTEKRHPIISIRPYRHSSKSAYYDVVMFSDEFSPKVIETIQCLIPGNKGYALGGRPSSRYFGLRELKVALPKIAKVVKAVISAAATPLDAFDASLDALVAAEIKKKPARSK